MTQKKDVAHHTKKRPYGTPELTVHGNLKALTMAKGGTSSDGQGKPRTKASGGNA